LRCNLGAQHTRLVMNVFAAARARRLRMRAT
jgi:hypothetical protein